MLHQFLYFYLYTVDLKIMDCYHNRYYCHMEVALTYKFFFYAYDEKLLKVIVQDCMFNGILKVS